MQSPFTGSEEVIPLYKSSMKTFKTVYFGLIALVILVGIYLLYISGGGDTNLSDPISVEVPKPGDVISSPLEVRGEARGTWFFEADFPIILRDEEGAVLGTSIGKSEGEWMTEDFVPFSGTIDFSPGKTEGGILELKRANPSGLPEHDASYEVPVLFKSFAMTSVKVFFAKYGPDSSFKACEDVFPVTREVPKVEAIGAKALEELLSGLRESEEDGFFTNIPEGARVKSLEIEDGVAYADFSREMNVAGSCRVIGIRAQITETLKQFSTVSDVVISVEGSVEEALQP